MDYDKGVVLGMHPVRDAEWLAAAQQTVWQTVRARDTVEDSSTLRRALGTEDEYIQAGTTLAPLVAIMAKDLGLCEFKNPIGVEFLPSGFSLGKIDNKRCYLQSDGSVLAWEENDVATLLSGAGMTLGQVVAVALVTAVLPTLGISLVPMLLGFSLLEWAGSRIKFWLLASSAGLTATAASVGCLLFLHKGGLQSLMDDHILSLGWSVAGIVFLAGGVCGRTFGMKWAKAKGYYAGWKTIMSKGVTDKMCELVAKASWLNLPKFAVPSETPAERSRSAEAR